LAGIYIHIPFCKQACYYCDFHFSTTWQDKKRLIDAVLQELVWQKSYLNDEPIDTIYFGGGTPSLLPTYLLQEILNIIAKHYQVSANPEITLEANPDDLNRETLREFYTTGINRLSIGIQTFNDLSLKFLNRAHSAAQAVDSMDQARQTGFSNISIDLIYGIPNRAEYVWLADLEKTLSLAPEHISAYCLTIEPNTVFGRWELQHKLTPVDEDLASSEFELLIHTLEKNHYLQYEVSNFAMNGYYSRHNSGYWEQKKYLGVGPSAHSFNGFSRQFNINNNALYIKSVKQNKIPATVETLSRAMRINEYLMTTLRTVKGCDLSYLLNQFGYDLIQNAGKQITTYCHQGLMKQDNQKILLTKKGLLVADKIAMELFTD